MTDMVIYFDENRYPNIGWVAYVFKDIHGPSGRPRCNLAIVKPDGRFAQRVYVEPAYHNGVRWKLINKWAFKGEVPEEEWAHVKVPQFNVAIEENQKRKSVKG